MDHLPVPYHCRGNIPVVPYLGLAPKYDELGFKDFPERHGLSTDSLQMGDFDQYTEQGAEWLESFLQEWLFFGTLHEFSRVCNVPLQLTDFIRVGGGKDQEITTRPLLSYARHAVQELVISIISMGRSDLEISAIREAYLQRPLRWHSEFLVACSMAYSHGLLPQTFPMEARSFIAAVQTASRSLITTISNASRIVVFPEARRRPALRISLRLSIGFLCSSLALFMRLHLLETTEILLSFEATFIEFDELLRSRGWCPNRSVKTFANPGTYFIVSCLPSYDTRPHRWCLPEACSEPLSRVGAKHNADCDGSCEYIEFDEQDLVRILRGGGNPGVIMCTGTSDAISYKLVDASKYPFVAISHVWAHGLGNASSNGLPNCQISRLFDLIAKLPTPHGGSDLVLWIDTLCVPTTPGYKSLGIPKLREVYGKASKVLILDINLMQVGTNWLERRLQLLCSEWSRRLWTLQESRLAVSLYVQYKDEAVDVKDLWHEAQSDEPMTEEDLLNDTTQESKREIMRDFHTAEGPGKSFSNLIDDLAYRSTTEARDEPICVGTLLDLKLEDFGGSPTMIDIYRSCQRIPENIIFAKGPRLKVEGLRWAPSTFLNRGFQHIDHYSRDGTLTTAGFQLVKDGIQISDNFELDYQAAAYYSICFDNRKISWTFNATYFKEYHDEFGFGTKKLFRPALILQSSEERT